MRTFTSIPVDLHDLYDQDLLTELQSIEVKIRTDSVVSTKIEGVGSDVLYRFSRLRLGPFLLKNKKEGRKNGQG